MNEHERAAHGDASDARKRGSADVTESTRIYAALALALSALLVGGCEQALRCTRNADCIVAGDGGARRIEGVCSARGFCQRECNADIDCPCGSFCGACGVCVRDDLEGAATCFAFENSYTDLEVLAFCLRELPGTGDDGGPMTSGRSCPGGRTLPRCERLDGGAPVDAFTTDAGAPTEDAGTAPDTGVETDAALGVEDGGETDAR